MNDLQGHIFSKIRRIRLKAYSIFCSAQTMAVFSIRGIKIGKGLRCFGIPVSVRAPESSIQIGKNCSFRSDFTSNLIGINRKCIITTLKRKSELIIGDFSGFSGTVIAAAGSIRIGSNVLCGANTTITDFDWHGIEPELRNSSPAPEPVVIEDNVWLGLNSIVLKGVRIGKNSVIGANSVVTKDIPPNVIAAGNPCRVIRELKNVSVHGKSDHRA
jgi:acetyltransferase-like isoleucine patch superfamily enzyme